MTGDDNMIMGNGAFGIAANLGAVVSSGNISIGTSSGKMGGGSNRNTTSGYYGAVGGASTNGVTGNYNIALGAGSLLPDLTGSNQIVTWVGASGAVGTMGGWNPWTYFTGRQTLINTTNSAVTSVPNADAYFEINGSKSNILSRLNTAQTNGLTAATAMIHYNSDYANYTTYNGISWAPVQQNHYIAKTATYSILVTDYVVDCTSGTFTATLPTAVGFTGKTFVVKNSGAGTITLATTSSQNIDGVTTKTLSSQYSGYTVMSDGTGWKIISAF
jgi:hypothetical protein